MSKFEGRDQFAADWQSEEVETMHLVDAVERPGEEIVNDIQEIIAELEREAADIGTIPQPNAIGSDDDAGRWWEDATAAGLVSGPRQGSPGRWFRLRAYGVLDDEIYDAARRVMPLRQAYQHGYRDLEDEEGDDIWDKSAELLDLTPRLARALYDWTTQVFGELG
jgi:hypothetical protein